MTSKIFLWNQFAAGLAKCVVHFDDGVDGVMNVRDGCGDVSSSQPRGELPVPGRQMKVSREPIRGGL